MDCFAWVNRDSYLPQGSRGLKAVTVVKLGYDPDELDPELMTPFAAEQPQVLAEYSVSDAVATYYLYMKYVHPFIFSLCTIIPLGPDDVLRKGTGTLCEMLLMVQAYQKNIILPNKHKEPKETFWDGHLLESETYVGGHVESIEAGVFRSDIATPFKIDPNAIDELLHDLDAALRFSIEVEEKKNVEDIADYEDVKAGVIRTLEELRNRPVRNERPLIYHLDVASMYPNIMTTNRLQPDSMIDEADCAACDFNRPGKTCDRRLPWAWRGEFLPAKKNEYNMIRRALESEKFPNKYGIAKMFSDLNMDDQATIVKKRLQDYSKKVYHKIHDSKTVQREAIICQRENPFYVDTVRDFRDRRYEFKGKQKVWKAKTEALKSAGAPSAEVDEAGKMIIVFDSLQLAHKVILNSFYGYVMRKGSRWYSMEMAGVTCLTGAHIIQMARELVERLGRPLELDTDGIWCMLPCSFPEDVSFTMKNGKKLKISYPCTMLNHLVHARFTNHQYQTLKDKNTFKYETHSDNTIFFEVDGPYKAMVLPTSKEEDKNLKKRYAVFNDDGSLAELKGFEVKRRGELKLIKIFQNQIFKFFLEGSTLEETYQAVAKVANKWLDVLDQRGSTLADEELVELICENKSMAKTLEEYGAQKSTAITTAKRLAEFLGEQMVKDKGLNCKYIIASRPRHAPVTERAIPVAIFSSEESVKRSFLRKWMKDDPGDMDLRTILDWGYYAERLGSVIQKLITIPAALQKIPNPVPRVQHPDWLLRRNAVKDDRLKQKKMTDLFSAREPLKEIAPNAVDYHLPTQPLDVEDIGGIHVPKSKAAVVKPSQKRKSQDPAIDPIDPYASLKSVLPDPKKDYKGFLRYQKKKWKIQKEARVRRKQLFGEQSTKSSDLGGFFRDQTALQLTGTWQILQLRETEVPGIIRAFVLIDKKVHNLKLKVPRTVFLNLKHEDMSSVVIEGCVCERVKNYTLPDGHPSTYLFKVTMPEEAYVGDSQKVAQFFDHPSVEGVYEKNVPLSMRAVMHLGSSCVFDQSQQGVLGSGLENGFEMHNLKPPSITKSYLGEAVLGYYYLYHVAEKDRQVFAIFSTTRSEAHIVVLDKSRNEQGFPKVEKVYGDSLTRERQRTEAEQWQDYFDYQDTISFTTTHVTTQRKAYLELSKALKSIQKDESQAVMMVVQSPRHRQLVHALPSLKELPILSLKSEDINNKWPTLGWQTWAVKRMISNYLSLGSWIGHLLNLARYGDIPLCNLEQDDPRFLIDVAYARRLQQSQVVLWWSENPLPDHAGYQKDDVLGPLDNLDMPGVNNSGAYSSVCVDMSLRNLAINTILTSSLKEAEDSRAAHMISEEMLDGQELGVQEPSSGFAAASVSVLKRMVKTWWVEGCKNNVVAENLIQNLVRWVESPSSRLYDRSLHQYVRTESKTSFEELVRDFKRVGSHVVFASPSRLLLQTTKAEVGNAYAYSEYMVKAIKGKPQFEYLDLNIMEYWDYLVWYDEFNYGGKGCSQISETDDQPLDMIMHWQLATFLPDLYQPIFNDWVVEFIELMHTLKRPHTQADGLRLTQLPPRQIQSADADGGDPANPSILSALASDIGRPLKKQTLALISRYRTEMHNELLASDHAYPVLPGSHLQHLSSTNPVLQLTKSLMHVYSLDKSLELAVRALRRDLLALFEVREFSAEGRFDNPSASLKIESWSCSQCCLATDIDLCRDESFLPPQTQGANGGEGVATSLSNWSCPECHAVFDRFAIEERLIARVQEMLVRWATQDIRCKKCRGVRTEANEFMDNCGCSGAWAETVDKKGLRKDLGVLEKVAATYGLILLVDVVKDVQAGL